MLLVSLFLQPVSAAQLLSQNLDTQEVSISLDSFLEPESSQQKSSTQNLNKESKSLTDSEPKQQTSSQPQKNASELLNNQNLLLDNLEEQWKKLELQAQALAIQSENYEKDNRELKNMLSDSKKTIQSLRTNLDEYKVALQSNKEDTGYIVGLFAEAQEELDNIKKYVAKLENDRRHLRNSRITSITFTAVGIGMASLANLIPDEKVRNAVFWSGIGMAAAGGVTLTVSFIF